MKTSTPSLPSGRATALAYAVATLSTLLLVVLPEPAAAAIDCWMDAEHRTTADQRAVADPVVAPMRRALQ